MNKKLDFFSHCLLKNASCQSNNENKDFETLAATCCKIQPNKKFDGNSNSYTEFVPRVREIVNESGELHQEQARLYQ